MKPLAFIEALDLSEAVANTENRVIEGAVLIRAGMSKNRRYYGEPVLQACASVFEGAKAYANHPSKSESKDRPERSVRDITGWYANVRYENGALRGDRYFTRTQAGQDAWAIAEDILSKRAPASLAGLSINAVGTGNMKKFDDGDALEVDSITAALSVDDVSNPAAGGGYLLTASDGDELTNALLEAMTFEQWFEARPEYTKRLQNEMKTIRQDEALKAAKAEAERTSRALSEAQALIDTLKAERDAAVSERDSKARELALEQAFRKAGLPKVSEDDLRQRLMGAAPEHWQTIISGERDKLKALGLAPKIAVTGAGQQVAAPVREAARPDPVQELRERLKAVTSPEDLKRIQNEMGR